MTPPTCGILGEGVSQTHSDREQNGSYWSPGKGKWNDGCQWLREGVVGRYCLTGPEFQFSRMKEDLHMKGLDVCATI